MFTVPAEAYDRHVGRYGAEPAARLIGVAEDGELVVSAKYESFEGLWAPFAAGVGPSGEFPLSLDEERRRRFRDEYRGRLGSPAGPFRLTARAWYATGRK
jgi:hypothetical protein